mmetsp:Transcript_97163/g.299478  ORF Transcript_97163/g.299478 Transcript_97163/m.299478 type:complete len:202 (+) Transcript_97163:2-607(+)
MHKHTAGGHLVPPGMMLAAACLALSCTWDTVSVACLVFCLAKLVAALLASCDMALSMCLRRASIDIAFSRRNMSVWKSLIFTSTSSTPISFVMSTVMSTFTLTDFDSEDPMPREPLTASLALSAAPVALERPPSTLSFLSPPAPSLPIATSAPFIAAFVASSDLLPLISTSKMNCKSRKVNLAGLNLMRPSVFLATSKMVT